MMISGGRFRGDGGGRVPARPGAQSRSKESAGRRLITRLPVVLLLGLLLAAGCGAEGLAPEGSAPTLAPAPRPVPALALPEVDWPSVLPFRPQRDIVFEHLSLAEGLSQSVVSAMAQDHRGFLWLGTQDGLNRYDGYDFKVFKQRPDDPHSLSNNFITSLLVDEKGTLWVGSNGGLDRHDAQLERFTHYRNDPADPHSLSADTVTAIAAGPAGELWVGTGDGLNHFDPANGRFKRYLHDSADSNSIVDDGVTEVLVDGRGVVWIGTAQGLDRYDPESDHFTHFVPDAEDPQSLQGTPVAAVYEDREGTIWVGTNQGLNRLDRQSGHFTHYGHDPQDPQSLSDDGVTAIRQDRRGTLWVGTNLGGLNRFDPASESFVHYRHDPQNDDSLVNESITCLFEDASGIVWVGTFGGGVDRYDRQKAKFLHVGGKGATGLSDDVVWSFLVDRLGTLWVGTVTGGLNRADPGSDGFHHYLNDPQDAGSLNNNQVWQLFEDSQGTVWVGTGAGLDRLDRAANRFDHYDMAGVFTIHEAADGTFWLGTLTAGLARFERETGAVTFYQNDPQDPHSLSGNFVTDISEGEEGTLWMGTFTAGLNRFDPQEERFTSYQSVRGDAASLPNNTVLTVFRDSRDRLWVGTPSGLSRFEEESGQFTTYGEQDGLPNEMIYAILEDGEGLLWISTNRGLSRFDPERETFENYDVSDGLQSMEFNQGAAYEGPAGEMYFGGINGFNVFHPQAIRQNSYLPPVLITGLQLFNSPVVVGEDSPLRQAISEADEIRLGYRDDFLTFEYAALHFSSPEENQYAYMMEGFDRDWNDVGNRRFASYTGLPPGDYTFRVKASNSDGLWNEQGATVRVVITPPFWQTWWFITLVVVLATGTVFGAFALRIRAVEKQRRHLAQVVDERTRELQQTLEELRRSKAAAEAANRAKSVFLTNVSHELRTPLNAIIGFSQLMIRSAGAGGNGRLTPEQEEDLHVIQTSGEHLLRLINEVLEMSKIEAGRSELKEQAVDLWRLLEGLESMFGLRAREKGLALAFDVAPELPRTIRADEGKLRQIVINLLGNAVKFTEKGGIVLRARACPEPSEAYPGDVGPLPRAAGWLHVEVEDSGPGIGAEDLETIFLPFAQSAAGTAAQEGTGLGLAISREFARLMGGDLWAHSEPGRGSTFILEVPLVPAEGEEAREIGPQRVVKGLAAGQPAYRLLIVDDSEANRKLLVRILAPLGFEVREAVDGKEALEIWEAWSPHLIWMDMRMPVMDGYEATRRIKASTRGQATVVVALTASALEEDREVILSEGCDDYVRKPFREEELFDVLARHLGLRFVYEEEGRYGDRDGAAGKDGDEDRLAGLAQGLAALPPEWREALRAATVLGYEERIGRLIDEARGQAPEVARHLARLAERYDHEAILELVEQAGKER